MKGSGRSAFQRFLIPAAAVAVVILLAALLIYNWDLSQSLGEPLPAAAGTERRVILLVVDRLGYRDLIGRAEPQLRSLLEKGALALMNARSGRAGSESAYLSLGTAARAVAGLEGGAAYNLDEMVEEVPAAALYRRLNGKEARGEVIFLHPYTLQEKNDALNYPVRVGFLGEQLAVAGLTAAVRGNADGAAPARHAALIAMDPAGQVPLGDVGAAVLTADPLFPYGLRTDPAAATAAVAAQLGSAALVVLDFGDLARLDHYWPQLAPERRAPALDAALKNLDQLLAGLLTLVDEGTMLLLVAPSPPLNRAGGGLELTPLVMVSAALEPGLLTSSTTRRLGLITNTDLAPLLLSYLKGEAPAAGGGQSLAFTPSGDASAFLERFFTRAELTYRQRPALLKGYVLAMIITLPVSLASLALRHRTAPCLFRILEGLMLVPAALLLLPAAASFPLPAAWLSGALLAGTILLLLLALQPLRKMGRPAFWAALGLFTSLAVIIAALAGARLQQLSFLGYDPIGGSRFYGIGNEYMGVVVGASILGVTALAELLERGSRSGLLERGKTSPVSERMSGRVSERVSGSQKLLSLAVLLFFGLIIVIFASPRFGANLGGTITAAVAYAVAWGITWPRLAGLARPARQANRLRNLAVIAAAFLLFALAALWAFNFYWQPPFPSHLGNFGEMVGSRGVEAIVETVQRKLSMNWRLIRYSIWSRAFLTMIGLLVVLFFYPIGALRRLKEEQPYLINGAAASVAGSVAALLLNDSGIVAAATILLYAVPPVLIAMITRVWENRSLEKLSIGPSP